MSSAGVSEAGDIPFAHPVERELARLFDEHGVRWLYEPHTFVLESDPDGTVREAFTPDFFLPDFGLYVECTVMRQSLTRRKRKKVRKAIEQNGVTVEVLFGRDFVELADRWSLATLGEAAAGRRNDRVRESGLNTCGPGYAGGTHGQYRRISARPRPEQGGHR